MVYEKPCKLPISMLTGFELTRSAQEKVIGTEQSKVDQKVFIDVKDGRRPRKLSVKYSQGVIGTLICTQLLWVYSIRILHREKYVSLSVPLCTDCFAYSDCCALQVEILQKTD